MDEIDTIIIHTLKQIGCQLVGPDESEVFRLTDFSPDLLVGAVSRCLQEIRPGIKLPKSLPENMAQRFSVATSLAEECSSCGYKEDIGYQTFLYINVVDIRRLFMFLIEQFPKEQKFKTDEYIAPGKSVLCHLLKDISTTISRELKLSWTPPYCRGVSNKKSDGISGLSVDFFPQISLYINQVENHKPLKEFSYTTPNIFSQCSSGGYDLVSSVLHKNAIDVFSLSAPSRAIHLSVGFMHQLNYSHSTRPLSSEEHVEDITNLKENISTTPLKTMTLETDILNREIEICNEGRKNCAHDMSEIRQRICNVMKFIEDLNSQAVFHEKTCVVLENPSDHIEKLEGLIAKTRERRSAIENQWQQHRCTALSQIDNFKKIRQAKNIQNIQELRERIQSLESSLRMKTIVHGQLADELKKRSIILANRKEYTRRIYEFISNIRKQRNDIYKVIDDTRDLQKQINSVSAQLQRQFNYTDDLLFQSAKHDLHAKRAYKLLVSLHSSCNEICEFVSSTGQFAKESRDLELQVERERMCNTGASLQKITIDIDQFKILIKSMQSEISLVENEITFR